DHRRARRHPLGARTLRHGVEKRAVCPATRRAGGVTLLPLRKNRDFVLLQVGQTLSTIGSESTGIAYPLLVLAVTHSPVKAGVVGFARVVPWALFGFLAGAAVDRFHRKRMMIVSDIVRVAAVTSIVVSISQHRLSFVQIAIVAF